MAGAALVVFVVGLIVSWLWDPVFIVSSEATEAATCLPNTDGVHCIFGKDWNESGYSAWVEFNEQRSEAMDGLIPTLLVNPNEEDTFEQYSADLTSQLESFTNNFTGVAYRASVLVDVGFLSDLDVIRDQINDFIGAGNTFYIFLDHEFIRPGTGIIHAARTIGLIESIREIIPNATIVTLASSFPRNIEELGDPENGAFPTEEVFLNQELNRLLPHPVGYGDYGSINPTRNDLVFASGWRPRIDFPTSQGRTYYYREKRVFDYADHYVSVAQDVVSDPLYEEIDDCWGEEMIEQAAGGTAPGKSPQFWISVRMNIHIHQQVIRLDAD